MKPLIYFLKIVLITAILFIFNTLIAQDHEEHDHESRHLLHMENRLSKLKDENGEFHPHYHLQADKQVNELSASRSGGLNLNWEELGPDNIGGRILGLIVDNRDPNRNTIYAGAANGGVWKSTDKGNSWKIVNYRKNLNVSCMAQAPDGTIYIGTGDGFGFPNGSSFQTSSLGDGLYKLMNNDVITRIQSTTPVDTNLVNEFEPWSSINRIAVNPRNSNHLVVGTLYGLYVSRDAGNTWTRATSIVKQDGSTINPNQFRTIGDLGFTKDSLFIFATYSNSSFSVGRNLIRSNDGGLTWLEISKSATMTPPSNDSIFLPNFTFSGGRITLAFAHQNPGTLYISIADVGGCGFHGYKTTNYGSTWIKFGDSNPTFLPFSENCEGWYHNRLAVSPANDDIVYLGGNGIFTYNSINGWRNSFDISVPPQLIDEGYRHIGSFAFDDLNPDILYVGTHIGILKSIIATSNYSLPNFSINSRGLANNLMYSLGAGKNGNILAGSQCSGNLYLNKNPFSSQSASKRWGIDGIYSEISFINSDTWIYGATYGNIVRSFNNGVNASYFFDNAIDPNGINQPSRCGSSFNNTRFITNFYLEETFDATNAIDSVFFKANRNFLQGETVFAKSKTKDSIQITLTNSLSIGDSIGVSDRIKSRLYLPTNCGLWMTPNAITSEASPSWFRLQTGVNPTCLSQTATGDSIYFANGNKVYQISGLNGTIFDSSLVRRNGIFQLWDKIQNLKLDTFTINGLTGRNIEGIYVDRNNSNHVIVCVSGYTSSTNKNAVFKSTNGGSTFINISNNLPNIPVYSCVISAYNSDHYIIGTEFGVFASEDGGATWHEENAGVGRVPVYNVRQLQYLDKGCYVLYLATHGRGAWRNTSLLKSSCKSYPLSINQDYNDEIESLTIYPNPASSDVTVRFKANQQTEKIELKIVDLMGKEIIKKEIKNSSAEIIEKRMDISSLSKGIYVISVYVDGKKVNFKSKLVMVE